MSQTEKDSPSLDKIEATIGQRPIYWCRGKINGFQEGWAVNIVSYGKTAHYYRRNRFGNAVALCGKWVEVRWIYGAGNYPHCKTCERAKRERTR